MLAAANWPLAELLNKPLAQLLNLPAITDVTGGRAPSIPNGGLGEVNAVFWFIVLAIGALAEVGEIKPLAPDARLAGDLGFDPLGLWGKMDAAGKRDIADKELANGCAHAPGAAPRRRARTSRAPRRARATRSDGCGAPLPPRPRLPSSPSISSVSPVAWP
jgi:hypothetical protein